MGNESNGHAAAIPEGMLMVPLGGNPSDIVITHAVAASMLGNLLDRDEVTFTVLLGEAMTRVRLAKGRHRAGPAEMAERRTAG